MFRMVFILFLSALFLAGCAAGEQPQWGEAGKAVTFRVTCKGNLDPGFVYRIAVDTDGNALTGPSSNPSFWEEVYVLEWRNGVCYLLSPDGTRVYIFESTFSGQTAEATVDLEALGNPDQMEVMALVEDDGGNVLDYLRNFFPVRLKYQQSVTRTDEEGDASEPSADILRVSVEVSF
ncbi:MAG: hypothetical protein H5U36_05200 [Candidatus Caldatribacterium sp.]|nr:hypothetical protein [Candidatus Caldatribacterium sp.]